MDLASVKPSIMSALVIFLIVMITVPLAKYAFAQFYVPGLSELTAAI